MSDLLRLARELDGQAEDWRESGEEARAIDCKGTYHQCIGRAAGLRQAAEMARHMHNQGSMRRDVDAGDASEG